jgi:uncharacterized membrane protein
MNVQPWDIGTVLATAWERFKEHAAGVLIPLIVAGVIAFVVSMVGNVANQLAGLLAQTGVDEVVVIALSILVQLFFGVINFLVGTWFLLGKTKVYLKAARGTEPEVGDLFDVGPLYVSALLVGLILVALWIGGFFFTFFLLWIPLIIAALGFWMYKFLLVDQELGPVECLQESWRITKGEKLDLFLWWLVTFAINIVGALCCLVGLIVTVPVTMIGTALIYDNLVAQKGRFDGKETGGAAGSSGSGYDFEGSERKPPPASRATRDGNAPLAAKD